MALAGGTGSSTASPARLELRGIVKHFGGVQALRGADLTARRGEILGLCGENGAGKSTLLKVLSGVYPHGSYDGEVRIDGALVRLAGTRDAHRNGIAIVHQELMLVPQMTVAENLFLGREPSRFGFLDDARQEAEARALVERFGFAADLDVTVPVGRLGTGLQQVVEIVRTLALDASILVLDEPTAALTERESGRLLELLRELRARGTTCIYVSHRMDEIFALCDRITVLRDGQTAGTLVTAEVEPRAAIALMVGREVPAGRPAPRATARGASVAATAAAPAIELVDLSLTVDLGGGGGVRRVVDGVSLAVAPGEVVALCGAMGAGRTALLSTLFGAGDGKAAGTVRVEGRPVRLDSPAAAIASGLVLLPEDRKGRGLVLGMRVDENLSLPSLASPEVMGPGARLGLVDDLAEVRLATARIQELRIRGTAEVEVATLSGGNQQKVVLGKWLARAPRVLLLDEPTRGVDVGAREEIYALVEALCARGVAVLMASSDLVEVLRLAHRIVVLRDGRIVGELASADATQAAIVHLSTGAATLSAPGAPGEARPS